jgi:hypothetical protein
MKNTPSRLAATLACVLVFMCAANVSHAASSGEILSPQTQDNLMGLMTLSPHCSAFFGLSSQSLPIWDNHYLTPQLCNAETYLFARYTVGACGTGVQGVTNNAGITGLYPPFAEKLYALIVAAAASTQAPNLSIIYGYVRPGYNPTTAGTCAAYGTLLPEHRKGCAVTVNVVNNDCSGPYCKWLQANAAAYGMQVPKPGQYNVLMPADVGACMNAVSNVNISQQSLPAPANNASQRNTNTLPAQGSRTASVPAFQQQPQQTPPQTNASISSDSAGSFFSGPMGQMFGLMMGMQLGTTLSSALSQRQSSAYSQTSPPAPAPLPPAPILSGNSSASGGDSSTLDALLAALNSSSSSSTSPQACTQEVQICPDGSAVGRTGPNCSFAACPSATVGAITSSTSAATGTATQLSSTTVAQLQAAYDSLGAASATIAQSGSLDSTSTLQSILANFGNMLATLLSALFGLGAAR